MNEIQKRKSEAGGSPLTSRTVARIVNGVRQLEGGGFVVRRPFPTRDLSDFDPFLLLDEMGPVDYPPGKAVGAPDHPHRGFETVTYVLAGRMEHKDSAGHAGMLGPGDVQWMTAGAGVVHSEMPEREFLRAGGRMHGFQLWVNLPRRDKMMPPRYQEAPSAKIPAARTPDGGVVVRVVAGEALGATAVIDTRTPIMYLHLTLRPGARIVQPVPRDYHVFAYLFSGEGRFGGDERPAKEGHMVIFGGDGDGVALASPATASGPLELLLIGGAPLREPVARYGPFVMNTRDEVTQAFEDYQSGRMGRIAH
ncbi:MAG: pirin family protein [Chloroflexi bacterium]|nr:pirin family protein [Chloroflexota bacterium]